MTEERPSGTNYGSIRTRGALKAASTHGRDCSLAEPRPRVCHEIADYHRSRKERVVYQPSRPLLTHAADRDVRRSLSPLAPLLFHSIAEENRGFRPAEKDLISGKSNSEEGKKRGRFYAGGSFTHRLSPVHV